MHREMCGRNTDELVTLFNEQVGGGCSGSPGGRATVYIQLVANFDSAHGFNGAR